ncbi:MAG: HAMP domain-containing histidine kinase [Muribaculum sp.]|nr:HAMP domain-containing histidine kinase [Muribaculum sp.]
MKRFRTITIITLAAIAVMVAANVVYLHSLYESIREQTLQTATDCLRRADILEIISRMNGTQLGDDDSFIRITLMIQGEKSEDGNYEYPNLLENINNTMSNYFHFITTITPDMPERDDSQLAALFLKELEASNLYPKDVVVSETAIDTHNNKYWSVCLKDSESKPILYGYISPLSGYVLKRMSGIIITSTVILFLMSFLIWYLLHLVGKLRTIEQMKDDFTHNMTHELKTPVAVAYSAADSMLRYYDQSDEHRNKKLLTIIIQRLNFLSGMIENILSMSMERFKTMRLNMERIHLKPIVEDVAAMIEMKADKPVRISVDIEESVEVLTDSQHFGNVISNLLDNAVKYSGDTVDIKVAGNNSEISVSDNGIGIAKENLPFIFDKFYRVTDGNRYEVGGYGLGLYYVKQIVEMQGWSISVLSEENEGTTFTIKFNRDEKR